MKKRSPAPTKRKKAKARTPLLTTTAAAIGVEKKASVWPTCSEIAAGSRPRLSSVASVFATASFRMAPD